MAQRSRFKALDSQLRSLIYNLSTDRSSVKQLMLQLSKLKPPSGEALLHYHNLLLFLAAHPHGDKERRLVSLAILKLSRELKQRVSKSPSYAQNSGLPYTRSINSYSHDCLQWLAKHTDCRIEIRNKIKQPLNELLYLTLPSVERGLTTAGYTNQELLSALGISKNGELIFYLNQFDTLSDTPLLKDHLFEKLEIEVRIEPRNKNYSHAFNRISTAPFFQREWIRSFDITKLLNRTLASAENTTDSRHQLVMAIKNTMALRDRETDPVTYLDPSSLRYYELDRGLSIAIYGMLPSRQLPLESYVGFTLFKNGFPASYGGCWIFGERAIFGINIFDAFRGGESGYVMCQILRLYRQVFGITFFEVEPYQFGLDNPEGIKSGAFWFYYKHGFRPASKSLRALAKTEYKKIKARKSYRSSKSVLLSFTEANLQLNLSSTTPPSLPTFTRKITKMIQSKYKGDRQQAIFDSISKLERNLSTKSGKESIAQAEVALFTNALGINLPQYKKDISQLIELKPKDLYAYQAVLLSLLKKLPQGI